MNNKIIDATNGKIKDCYLKFWFTFKNPVGLTANVLSFLNSRKKGRRSIATYNCVQEFQGHPADSPFKLVSLVLLLPPLLFSFRLLLFLLLFFPLFLLFFYTSSKVRLLFFYLFNFPDKKHRYFRATLKVLCSSETLIKTLK